MNGVGMSVAIFLHKLLELLYRRDFNFVALLSLTISIVLIELIKELGMDHINYYLQRLSIIMDASICPSVFQHGLCYRRSQFGHLSNNPDSCKSIIHNCSGEDACTDNPLLCPARRYKNNEVTPKMYALVLNDSHYIPYAVECASGLVDFLTTFTYGLILISSQFNMRAMTILIVSLSLVTCMILVEVINGFVFKYYIGIRDNRISKSEEVISGLHLIERMALDDIGHDIITETRNDELKIVFVRFLVSLVNKVIIVSIMCIDIIILVNDFVGEVREATDLRGVNPSGILASIFVIMKIIGPLYLLPFRLKFFVLSLNSFLRVNRFLRTCSPNFYLSDNKFSGKTTLPDGLPDKNRALPKGLVVMLKKASSVDNVNIDYGAVISNTQLHTLLVAGLLLYRDFFKVLLVDEPPEDESGASKTAEVPIYELIKTHFQHCTTFIAAHDTSVLRLCTSVWVFHKGSLIKTCRTEDVIDSGSLSKIIEDCISEHNNAATA